MHEFADVLPYDVEFEVHHRPFLYLTEVRVFVCIGYNGNLEAIEAGVAYGQTDTVHADRPFLYRRISLAGTFLVERIFKGIIPASVGFRDLGTYGSLIHMPLDDMPIQTPIHQHAAFEIDKAPGAEKSQVRAFERLLDCRYSIGLVRFADHGKADAIMRYTLIYLQLIDERTLHRDMDIPFVLCDSHYLSGFFNDT